jgi:hypothetical protein
MEPAVFFGSLAGLIVGIPLVAGLIVIASKPSNVPFEAWANEDYRNTTAAGVKSRRHRSRHHSTTSRRRFLKKK